MKEVVWFRFILLLNPCCFSWGSLLTHSGERCWHNSQNKRLWRHSKPQRVHNWFCKEGKKSNFTTRCIYQEPQPSSASAADALWEVVMTVEDDLRRKLKNSDSPCVYVCVSCRERHPSSSSSSLFSVALLQNQISRSSTCSLTFLREEWILLMPAEKGPFLPDLYRAGNLFQALNSNRWSLRGKLNNF